MKSALRKNIFLVAKHIVAGIVATTLVITAGIFSSPKANNVQAATPYTQLILNDTYVYGNIPDSDTINYYEVVLPSDGWLTITYQGWNIGDGYYKLVNQEQSNSYYEMHVGGSSDINPVTDSTTRALEKGIYILKVYGADSNTGDYKIKGSFTAAENNDKEPNGSFDKATPLPQNTWAKGFFSQDDDIDFYAITLPESMTVRLTYITKIPGYNFWHFGTYVSIWDADFLKKSDFNIDGSENSPSTKTLDLYLEKGINYVKIVRGGYDISTGRYQLKWEKAPVPVTNIQITGKAKIKVGESATYKVNILPSDADVKGVKWSSSDNSIAKVDSKGTVTAKKAGEVTIKATAKDDSGVYGSILITVKKNPITTSSKIVKKVSSVKAKALGKKKVNVSWKKQNSANKYEIQIATDKYFSKNLLVKNAAKSKSSLDIKYKKTGTVYIKIRALDKHGYVGKWSDVKTVKIK